MILAELGCCSHGYEIILLKQKFQTAINTLMCDQIADRKKIMLLSLPVVFFFKIFLELHKSFSLFVCNE